MDITYLNIDKIATDILNSYTSFVKKYGEKYAKVYVDIFECKLASIDLFMNKTDGKYNLWLEVYSSCYDMGGESKKLKVNDGGTIWEKLEEIKKVIITLLSYIQIMNLDLRNEYKEVFH